MSNLTKKEIVESLKALEIDYKPTQSVSELRKLLDKAMGVVEDDVDESPAQPEKQKKVEEKTKPQQGTGVSNRSISFAEISAYNRKKALEKLGK